LKKEKIEKRETKEKEKDQSKNTNCWVQVPK